MSFSKAVRTPTHHRHITQPRFTVRKSRLAGLTGSLKLPPEIIGELGWAPNEFLDVLVGDGEDAGWFGLKKSAETNHRSKLKIAPNGVGSYSSRLLVPAGITDQVGAKTPESRIGTGEEQGWFFFKA